MEEIVSVSAQWQGVREAGEGKLQFQGLLAHHSRSLMCSGVCSWSERREAETVV